MDDVSAKLFTPTLQIPPKPQPQNLSYANLINTARLRGLEFHVFSVLLFGLGEMRGSSLGVAGELAWMLTPGFMVSGSSGIQQTE